MRLNKLLHYFSFEGAKEVAENFRKGLGCGVILLLLTICFISVQPIYGQCPAGTFPNGNDLVTNGNFSSGNSGFSSSYSYCNSGNCLQPEKRYAIGTNANTYHNNFFGTGHGGSGNFMIVNGAGTPNTTVWQQTISVVPNSNYRFSAWICSLHPSSPAKVQFSINGTLIGSVFTAPSSINTWVQFSATWTSGTNTLAVIRIVNQNTTAAGNDFGLDDIFFQKCCVPITANAGSNVTLCPGQTSTSLTGTGSGGTPPYTYLWNNVNPAQTITVGAGVYTVQVSHVAGCPPAMASVTVNNTTITANAGSDKTVCKQSPACVISGSVTGATGGVWSQGGGTFSPNTTTLSGLTYTPTAAELAVGFVDLKLTTTGNGNCQAATDIVRINYVDFAGTPSVTSTPISCFGGNNGTATASVSGGNAPHTYLWNTSPAQTSATANNLGVGTYSVTIKNNLGCTTTQPVTITQPSPVSVSGTVNNISCSGGNNGSVSVTPMGGTGPYTYSWQPGGSTSATLGSLSAGAYTVTVKDSKLCTATATYTVTQPTPVTVSLSSTPTTCYNGTNGAANSTVTGGTSPYTYNWSTGATSANATGLSAGTYTLNVKDNKNCTTSNTVVVAQPTKITASANTVPETCNYSNDGSASASATGGTPNYTYLWQPGGDTTTTPTGLLAGTYTLRVTDAANCTTVINPIVAEPSVLTVNFVSQVDVSCTGGSNGKVTANATGGTGTGYSYSWTPAVSTTATASNLEAGTYTVTVTDSKGCTATNSVTITEPAVLSASAIATDETCDYLNDGSATATATGGTVPYTYQWQPSLQTTFTATSLKADTYTVTVTDAKGCKDTATATVNQPDALLMSFSGISSVSCFGGNDGDATVSATGGTSGYTYSWIPGGNTTDTRTDLAAGSYTVTATDTKGCTATNSVSISQPTAISTLVTTINETCNELDNGSATVAASGGTPAYTYLWSTGGITTATASNLAAGTYSVTVTDSLGCTVEAKSVITEPAPLTVGFVSQVNVSCFGGNDASVASNPTGGTANYTYLWSTGATSYNITGLATGTYSVTITDAQNCTTYNSVVITEPTAPVSLSLSAISATCSNGNDGSATAIGVGGTAPYVYTWMPGNFTGETVTNLSANTYSVTVMDALGCSDTGSVTVTEPPPIVLVTSSTNSDCGQPNGAVSVSVSGGNAPYTYLWQPNGQTTASVSGLVSGAYSVLVTDVAGCTAEQWGNVNENSAPMASLVSVVDVSCKGGANGSVTIAVSGGIAPYTYSWSPSGGTDSIATGLTAGNYTVVVTGNNGCQVLLTTPNGVSEPPLLTVAVTPSPVSCFNGNDGAASAVANGGVSSYVYEWMPGSVTGNSISGLTAATYTVKVTDNNSCIKEESVTITQPTAIASVLTSTPVSCFGGDDGTASAAVSGGTTPYSYLWMPGSFSSPSIAQLTAGTYSATITDVKGCVKVDSVVVVEPTGMNTVMSKVNAACGLAIGQAAVAATGGIQDYSYLWFPTGETGAAINGLAPATYSVTVTDSNGCVRKDTITVIDLASPQASVGSTTNISCNGANDGVAVVQVNGGTAPFTYLWSPSGGSADTAKNLAPGTYSVVVTDANNCQSVAAVSPEITQPNPIFIDAVPAMVTCFGANDGEITSTVTGGTLAYSYLWMPGSITTPDITALAPDTYTLQVTDANNCIQTKNVTITEPAVLDVAVALVTNAGCAGENTGEIAVTTTGGTPVYLFNWLPYGGSGDTASGLAAGTYTLTVADNNGCIDSINATVTEPANALAATSSVLTVSCFGEGDGIIAIQPTGGTPVYSYQWNPSVATTDSAFSLVPGNYVVTVTDNNGCETTLAAEVTEPPVLTGSLLPVNPSCSQANGAITSQVAGGTAPYTYLWQPGGAITNAVSGLSTGTFSLTVTDAIGCSILLTTTLTIAPDPVATISSVTATSCYGYNDGQASVSATQGTPPFTFNWLPYGGTDSIATTLDTGVYIVEVRDALGCVATDTAVIEQPDEITISLATVSDVLCNGGNTGAINVDATGGTGSYTYLWTHSGETTDVAANLVTGTYTVTVTDQNNCIKSISAFVDEPTPLVSVVDTLIHPICSTTTGSASIEASGGMPPYTYSWSAPAADETNSTAFALYAGSYTVMVTDSNGCVTNSNFAIVAPAAVVTIAGENDTICLGQSGSVSATATGGNGSYIYAWQPGGIVNGGNLNVTNPTSTITYTVNAYDQNNCPGNDTTIKAVVYNLTNSDVQLTGTTPICPGQSASIEAEGLESAGPLTYQWSNGEDTTAFVVIPAQPTTYSVTITNACGATITDSIHIAFNPQPTIDLTLVPLSVCVPYSMVFNHNSVAGNSSDPITQWLWDFGDGTTSNLEYPVHSYAQPGVYPVILTVNTDGGCTSNTTSTPFTVNAYPSPVAVFTMSSTHLNLPYDLLTIDNLSTGANSYVWNFGDGGSSTLFEPHYLYSLIGNFHIELIAMNQYGCADSAYAEVTTDADIVFPNAFTPNTAGSNGGIYDMNNYNNDIFFPYSAGVVEYELKIYNRWGELIFESHDIKQGWDGYYKGQLCQQDVYVWEAYAKLNNGRLYNKTGDVTLIYN